MKKFLFISILVSGCTLSDPQATFTDHRYDDDQSQSEQPERVEIKVTPRPNRTLP